MSDDELRAFLAEQMVTQCSTLGPRGRPHMVPLWYLPEGVELVGWTYKKSQKGKNLERDPHATLGIDHGVRYEELRGVMLECDVQLQPDEERVEAIGLRLFERYVGELNDDLRAAVAKQAPKRVGLRFVPTRIVSWDHRKLGGAY